MSEYEETLKVVRDPATGFSTIDQATAGPNRMLGKGAEVVGVDLTAATIKLTFDSDLDPATVSGGALILDNKGKQLDSTVTYADRTVTISGLDLKPGRQYRLVVLTTVRDVVGNNIASEYDLDVFGPVNPSHHGDSSGTPAPPAAQASPTPS